VKVRPSPRVVSYSHARTLTAAIGTRVLPSPWTPALNFVNGAVGCIEGHGPRLRATFVRVPPPLEHPATRRAQAASNAQTEKHLETIPMQSMTCSGYGRFLSTHLLRPMQVELLLVSGSGVFSSARGTLRPFPRVVPSWCWECAGACCPEWRWRLWHACRHGLSGVGEPD